MIKDAIFCFILALALCHSGCAAPAATRLPRSDAQIHLSAEARAELERKQQKKTKEEEEAFNTFSSKLDEYQDVVSVCERVSDGDETGWLKASCRERLKKLRQELIELRGILRHEQ